MLLLTTLIGAGQGLFIALSGAGLAGAYDLLPPLPASLYVAGDMVSLGLLVAGLAASFFHLGHPERAWRAITQWRTSWLSREVIALPVFMGFVFAHGVANLPQGEALRDFLPWITLCGVVACIALFVCTGMIYACLPFLQEWASPLTVLNFILLGCASGFTLAAAVAHFVSPGFSGVFAMGAIAMTALAFAGRMASLARNARLRPKSTLATAIGIKHPHIEQKSTGFLGGSFNTREFFHGRRREFVHAIKWCFLILGFPVPIALLGVAVTTEGAGLLLAGAYGAQYAGFMAERWYFFAEARHPQNLYYSATA